MYPNEAVKKLIEARAQTVRQIERALKPTQDIVKTFKANVSKIEVPVIEMPKIEFPKIKLPKIEIDYKSIEKVVNHNSKHGWTSTGEMHFNYYLDDDLLSMNQEQIDSHFTSYYENEAQKNYHTTKTVILNGINEKWGDVLEDCFELYEEEKYKVIIPMLITIIEGEISNMSRSQKVGNKLLKEWKESIDDKDNMLIIISYSLYEYLRKDMFVYKEFHDERDEMLNRNWVLHGRDNPQFWTKVDVLKLINLLSTIQFVKSVQLDTVKI